MSSYLCFFSILFIAQLLQRTSLIMVNNLCFLSPIRSFRVGTIFFFTFLFLSLRVGTYYVVVWVFPAIKAYGKNLCAFLLGSKISKSMRERDIGMLKGKKNLLWSRLLPAIKCEWFLDLTRQSFGRSSEWYFLEQSILEEKDRKMHLPVFAFLWCILPHLAWSGSQFWIVHVWKLCEFLQYLMLQHL